MAIDRDPMCSKMIRVSNEVHDMLCESKIIPEEPYNNCLKRIIAENNYLKRHYLAEVPRSSMIRDLQKFVLNPNIPDLPGLVADGHRAIWNNIHPEDPVLEGEDIHHINGDHNDNHPENLQKVNKSFHPQLQKELNQKEHVDKTKSTKGNIVTEPPEKIF